MKILLQAANFKLRRESISHIWFGNTVRDEGGIPGHEIITVGPQSMNDIYVEPGFSIEDILEKLPQGWFPDVYICQGPEYNVLPNSL